MCRASRQGNFSALSLWILQAHSPELPSLSLRLGRDSSWCFVVLYFFSSLFQLFLPVGCCLLGRCCSLAHKRCAGSAESSCGCPASLCCSSPLSYQPARCFICCCCFQPSPSPWGSLRSGFAAAGPPMMLGVSRACLYI